MELITRWSDGNVTITLNLTELAEMVEKMPERAENIINKIAMNAESYMKMRAAYETRAMLSSIYAVTSKHDGFGQAAGAAKGLNPNAVVSPHPNPPPMTAYVGPCVDYAIYQEFGTHKMAAHPFVTPGALKAAFDLEHLAPELFE